MANRLTHIINSASPEYLQFDKNHLEAPSFIISILAFVFYIWRWLRIEYGGADLWGDVTCCWEPLGHAVINGVPIYTTSVTIDNKPPLWHFVAIAGAWAGDVGLALLLVDGIAAMSLVYLTSKYINQILDDKRAAIIGAIAAFSIVIQIAYMSNNKLPAAALLFAAVYLRKPIYSGVLAGASVWVSQYTGLAIVSLGIFLLVKKGTKPFAKYVLSGVSISILIWGIVGAFWGMNSVTGGIKAAFFVAEGYAEQSGSVAEEPEVYIRFVNNIISIIYIQLIFAIGGISMMISGNVQLNKTGWNEIKLLRIIAVSLLPMFIFRFYGHYISFYVIPLSILISVFFFELLIRSNR